MASKWGDEPPPTTWVRLPGREGATPEGPPPAAPSRAGRAAPRPVEPGPATPPPDPDRPFAHHARDATGTERRVVRHASRQRTLAFTLALLLALLATAALLVWAQARDEERAAGDAGGPHGAENGT